MNKIKVLFIGNVPSENNKSIGGANTYTKALFNILEKENSIELQFLQIRKRWFKIGHVIDYAIFPFRFLSKALKNDVISIHATWDFHVTLGPFIVVICKLLKKKVIYHFFGGQFHHLYKNYPYLLRKWLEITIFKSDFKLMETKRMIEFFRDKELKNFIWFPNSRKSYLKENMLKPFSKKFVFISRVAKTKGMDYILDVAKKLPSDYSIDVYGPLDIDYNETDFTEGVISYKGVLKPENVISTLKKYDVLMLPTFHSGEGYPGIFIEAMSLGIPIISTNWNALDEIVENNINGKLISIKSHKELEEAILYFNSENYNDFCNNALNKFNNFNIDLISQKLINLYR